MIINLLCTSISKSTSTIITVKRHNELSGSHMRLKGLISLIKKIRSGDFLCVKPRSYHSSLPRDMQQTGYFDCQQFIHTSDSLNTANSIKHPEWSLENYFWDKCILYLCCQNNFLIDSHCKLYFWTSLQTYGFSELNSGCQILSPL